ncbi:Asp/Glu/hydantoin racemase [Methylobacterium sp. 4-46]|uniref:maleate cis-trans isomerase family protein n=1 Tax=unclassified Methylobacterium TaxID=2615210 RepID=UPI000152CF28|nr:MULTISPECIES: aspartate/glutamate racemase family protein [Methylobacterium]ACA15026.1 Asp/Glu/hydantoin racemase [Methylobacterium sp. 4-46]WFT80765.1 aspartate/glutamate racemase family protein [Methylobacterium nodulans]
MRLGMLTPSSNTRLEPATAAMLRDLPGVTAHFSRFRVTAISLAPEDLGQFDAEPVLAAADLLADAKVDVVAWNGTSAAWLGFDRDEALCAGIEARTGIAACTAVLGFRDVFRRAGHRRIGLVTPYRGDVQARIRANWEAAGFACAAERHAGLSDNFSFAALPEGDLAGMVRAVAAEGVEAVAIVCTNLDGTALAPALEAELGLPVYDSIAVTLWAALRRAGADPAPLARWGRLFAPCTNGSGC